MTNVVECPREFIAYFNALETTCGEFVIITYISLEHIYKVYDVSE